MIIGENAAFTSAPVNCTEMIGSGLGSVDCISYSWGMVLDDENHGVCNPKPYTSSVCRQQLLAWQECAVGGGEDVFLDLTFGELSQEEREKEVSQFLYFIRKLSRTCCFDKCSHCNCSIDSFLREFWVRILPAISGLACLSEPVPPLRL